MVDGKDSHNCDLLVTNIGELATPPAGSGQLRGSEMSDVVRVTDAAVAIKDGIVVAVDKRSIVEASWRAHAVHDAQYGLVTPGLIDCHSHPVFGGDRAAEFTLRNRGASYEEIHAAGGGIHSTVSATRELLSAGEDDCVDRVSRHLGWMLAAGTTTLEGKSGYALTHDGEVRSLQVLRRAAQRVGVDVHPTVLSAHTVPAEYLRRGDDYLDEVAIPALVQASELGLAKAADIFIENGSFSVDQGRRYLSAAREAGLAVRVHGDQFSEIGSIDLAIELGAVSIDHLEATSPGGVGKLASSNVMPVLLPLSSLFLRRPYAPGRALIDAGAPVAVASDFNPGSSYGESLTLAMTLACVGCSLTAEEALSAVTANAAWVLGEREHIGSVALGYSADMVVFDQPSLEHLPYHAGSPRVTAVIKAGRVVGYEH